LGSRITFADIHPDDVRKQIHLARIIPRTGIVWSPAPGVGTVWVRPDDGLDKFVMVRSPPRGLAQISLPKRIDTSMDIPWEKCHEVTLKSKSKN
jgi:hypothetical protein